MNGLIFAVSVLDFNPKWSLPSLEIVIVGILYSVPSLHSLFIQYVPDGGVPPSLINALLKRVISVIAGRSIEEGLKPVAATLEGIKKLNRGLLAKDDL